MKLSILIWGLTLSFIANANDPMCVRNYAKQGAGGVCSTFSETYAHVSHFSEKETEVCTRIYADFYCETAKEYEYVTTTDGHKICTLNYNQPPVANYCDSVPQYYDYIQKNPTE